MFGRGLFRSQHTWPGFCCVGKGLFIALRYSGIEASSVNVPGRASDSQCSAENKAFQKAWCWGDVQTSGLWAQHVVCVIQHHVPSSLPHAQWMAVNRLGGMTLLSLGGCSPASEAIHEHLAKPLWKRHEETKDRKAASLQKLDAVLTTSLNCYYWFLRIFQETRTWEGGIMKLGFLVRWCKV